MGLCDGLRVTAVIGVFFLKVMSTSIYSGLDNNISMYHAMAYGCTWVGT